jgi:uroporphyrinogen-III decarboxylase
MNSRQRMLAVWDGQPTDYVPLTMWCFGFPAPPALRWERDGAPVSHWFTKRLEHIHVLPQPWEVEDDFRRILAFRSLGVDDVLDVSIPWSHSPEVTWRDRVLAAGEPDGDPNYPVLQREYQTPAGALRHAVRQTGEDPGPGWVIQGDVVPLLDDFNIPRAVKPAVASPGDVTAMRHLYAPPDAETKRWFAERMAKVGRFAAEEATAVRAWAAFGMDAAVWLMGAENAILLAIDEPSLFRKLLDIIAETDYARIELAAAHAEVDIIAQRGWYSSTDFWSPKMFDEFVAPYLRQFTALAHRHGKRYMYTMETGTLLLGPRLADAGVDVLYGVDPILDDLSLDQVRETLTDRLTIEGGTHAMSLASGDCNRIRTEARRALETLGPTGRFILHPLDSLFPDTPWQSVQCLIDAWKEYR